MEEALVKVKDEVKTLTGLDVQKLGILTGIRGGFMKKSKIIIIISVAVLLLALCNSYFKFECNEITDTYDWITLRNIYVELDDFLDTYEKQYQNRSIYEFEIKSNLLLRKYFNQMHTYEWYLSLSPRLNSISYYVFKIADMNDDGISKKELVYLTYVRDSLKGYIYKINDELEEVSIRRMFGIFRKSNVAELVDIFNVNIDELNTVPGIFMSEVSLVDKRLAFTLINETDETIYYGEYITLEKQKNGKWYEISLSEKVGFTDILNYLSPHSEDKTSYPTEAWENISTGRYRFIKEFYLDEKQNEPKYIYKEFEL